MIIYQTFIIRRRGHEITAVTSFKEDSETYNIIESDPDGSIVNEFNMLYSNTSGVYSSYKLLPQSLELGVKANEQALSNPKMQQLIKDANTKFDIVIIQHLLASEIGYYLAYRFKAPFALWNNNFATKLPYFCSALGQPFNPSYMKMSFIPIEGEMNILHRAANVFVTFVFEHLYRNIYHINIVEGVLDKFFPLDVRPSLLEIERNVSLVLDMGNPFVLSGWSPMAPNYVQLGLINCKLASDFIENEQIRNFLDTSKKGVIYISFGSIITDSILGHKKEYIVEMFKKFHDYDFIWKWTEHISELPKNVLISKWLPQQDILAHQSLKVFITHVGFGSFQEAICYKKPIVGIPVHGDQYSNGFEAKKHGFGEYILFNELTEARLFHAIEKVLHNPKYTKAAQSIGSIMNDQMTRPLDRAVWWIEHIMRHPDAYQRKSPVHRLSWYQYFLLDVIALYLFIIYLTFKIVKIILKFMCCWKYSKTKAD